MAGFSQMTEALYAAQNSINLGSATYRDIDLEQRYFRENNGVADYYQLLEPAVISAGTDFEIEFSCSLNNLTVDSCIVGYKTTNLGTLLIYHDAPDGWRVLYYNGTVLTSWSTGLITSNSKLTTYSVVFSGDSVTFSNGSSSATGTLNGLGSVDIYFDLIGNQINTKLLDGIVSNLKLWRGGDRSTGQLTDWYKFDTPNSVYQRNHAVPQGVELNNAVGSYAKIEGSHTLTIPTSASLVGGNKYLVRFYVINNDSNPGIVFADVSISGFIPPDYEGWIEILSSPTNNRIGDLSITGPLSTAVVSDISIREFHGCEIIGGMPEDWFQVEKQGYWDYWREVGNESNILEIAQ